MRHECMSFWFLFKPNCAYYAYPTLELCLQNLPYLFRLYNFPIYADKKSNLMPSLLGAPNNRYRLFVLFLISVFVYISHRREQTYWDQIRTKNERIELLQREQASVLEKLRVIWLHKKKLEAKLQTKNIESDKLLSKIKLKELEVYGLRSNHEQCQRDLFSCENSMKPPNEMVEENKKNNNQEKEKYDQAISVLNSKILKLEGSLLEMANNGSIETGILKEELRKCESKIRQLTGGGAIEHYSQNETAHFNRNQKANEPLFFDRSNIQHHIPNKLLLGRKLAQTLEEAKLKKLEEREQMERHPDDRDNKDHEVNEQPDKDEQDYKEH